MKPMETKLNRRRGVAFSLTELMVVIAILTLLGGLAMPAFNLMTRSGDLAGATRDLAHLLEQARSYAMGKNTYVYLGILEVDVSQRAPLPSQQAASGVGRIVVGIVSARDGSRGYDPNEVGDPIWSRYDGGNEFSAVSPLRTFSNVHLADLGASTDGGMRRPSVPSDYNVGNASCRSATPVAWPPGRSLNSGQYNFVKVIQFDPQGAARIVLAGNGSATPQWIEIGLEPANGTGAGTAASGAEGGKGRDLAALQINGVSGAVRVYRP